MNPDDALCLYVVFDHPLDYPGSIVVRRNIVSRGGVRTCDRCWLFPDIETCRNALRRTGLVSIGRMPEDDPKILEVWL